MRARLARRRAPPSAGWWSRSTASGSLRSSAGSRRRPPGADAPRRPHAARVRERALARLPPGAARARPARARELLDLARGHVRGRRAARPGRATSASPGRRSPRWRSPASPRSASSTTCTTTPAATPYADPNELGKAMIAAAARGRDPHHAARHVLPARRDRRAAEPGPARASPTAPPRPGRERVGGARRRPTARASAPRSTASALSTRLACATVAAWAAERERPLARARLRAAGRERGLRRRLRRHPDRGARARRGAQRSASPPCMPRTSTEADIAALGSGAPAVAVCARRPSATSPTGSARPGRWPTRAPRSRSGSDSHAIIDPFEEARAVELDERLASGERGRHDARLRCCGAATAAATPRLGWDEAGAIEAGRARRPGHDRARRRPARRDDRRDRARGGACSPRPPPTSSASSCGGREIVRDGAHLDLDVAAELRESIAAVVS